MVSTLATLTLALAFGSAGGVHPTHNGGNITPPGPGNGLGFPNDNPDGYGFWYKGDTLPLGRNRTAEYYFPRYYALPAEQLFLPTYYNSYVTRGQRYIPWVNCGGAHPAGGAPGSSAHLSEHPSADDARRQPIYPIPVYSGRVEASPINPGGTGLTP